VPLPNSGSSGGSSFLNRQGKADRLQLRYLPETMRENGEPTTQTRPRFLPGCRLLVHARRFEEVKNKPERVNYGKA